MTGHLPVKDILLADLILTNTCAIRENAESKVFHRLNYFQSIREKNRLNLKRNESARRKFLPIVGVLGCMAERLKEKLLDEESVDFVVGPDSYRDIPRLLTLTASGDQTAANTQLSFDETYADIKPVRDTLIPSSAFITIMRGCNNMCSFCIVPYTRGRERSREMASILNEVESLVQEQGVREIVLLGQNVNGFHDTSKQSILKYPFKSYVSTAGFDNLYKRYCLLRSNLRCIACH